MEDNEGPNVVSENFEDALQQVIEPLSKLKVNEGILVITRVYLQNYLVSVISKAKYLQVKLQAVLTPGGQSFQKKTSGMPLSDLTCGNQDSSAILKVDRYTNSRSKFEQKTSLRSF